MEKCRKCGVELVVGETWNPSQAKQGSRICKACTIKASRKWQKEHPERFHYLVRKQRLGRPPDDDHNIVVYVLYAPKVKRYKIGQSRNPKRRVREVASDSPVEVELLWHGLCRSSAEVVLHAHFDAKRIHGEWFEGLTDEDLAFIKQQEVKE